MAIKFPVLITGASSGIGKATARYFSDQGHAVVLVGRHKERLEEVASQLKSKSLVLAVDVRREPEIEFMVHESIKVFPDLKIVVNNAGVFERSSFHETSEESWAKISETNILGPVRIMRKIIPIFLKQKEGMFVNIASSVGLRPVAGMAAYGTSKAALIHLTQTLALEYASRGLRFHGICPGVVETPIHGGRATEMAGAHPLGRVGTAEEVARAVYYLACESNWMTGVILPVDGGISLT